MTLVETINLISSTVDTLIDFAVNDEVLSNDFQIFLEKNEFDLEKTSEIQNCLISYIFDEKMQDYTRVLDYFEQNNPNYDKTIIHALKNSFISVFKVNKILKNGYKVTCLANEKDFELIPLVKMVNLRGIGLYDYIKARMIQLNGVFYLLEIFDCFGQIREYNAYNEAVKCLIKYPESQTMYNDEKLNKLKKSVKDFYEKFTGCLECDEIITSNTLADNFLTDFSSVLETGNKISKEKYLLQEHKYRFFEFDTDFEEDFFKNALGGFSNAPEPYDIGFFMDKDCGLYIIPFLGTFCEILKHNSLETVENAKECVEYIILSDKVSPNLIIKKANEYKNFISLVNNVFNKNFEDVREIISLFKADWIRTNKFSPAIVLYNSEIFEKVVGMEK